MNTMNTMNGPPGTFPGTNYHPVHQQQMRPDMRRHPIDQFRKRPRRSGQPDTHHGAHSDEEQLEEAVEAGSLCEIKRLYEGPSKCSCCLNWLEEPPEGADSGDVQKTRNKYGEFAVVQRKRQHGSNGQGLWKTSTITVQSALLGRVFNKVFAGYPDLSLTLPEVTLNSPFQPFLHRWGEFLKFEQETEDVEALRHVKLLRDIIEPEIQQHLKAKKECIKYRVIPFESLWTIFTPGELVYSKTEGVENIMKLTSFYQGWNMGRSWYTLRCQQVDWSGYYFGFETSERQIFGYNGTRSVLELEAMPLLMHPDHEAIMERMIIRGKKFETLRGYHFKAYEGPCQNVNVAGENTRNDVNGRIVIDALACFHFQGMGVPQLERFKTESAPKDGNIIPGRPPPGGVTLLPPSPPFSPPQTVLPQPIQAIQQDWNLVNPTIRPPAPTYNHEDLPPLTDDQLMLCVAQVRGFALKSKKWHNFLVEGVKEIDWDEDAFDSLVLPNEEKDLLLAFAQSKINSETGFDDFIQGKGKGIVMLLNGPPGVGKTLTAESIAEHTRVPLYTMSAGEIGIIPANVERHLKDALEKCQRWSCIFLLDECDVFLEKRDLNSLKRNELVSIFLRLVEYYEGIMFLTTNRIQAIDPAFESRIDVAVSYPPLTVRLRKQVWFNFLARLPGGKCELDETDMEKLAGTELNGRQIKSAVKTAQMLAGRQGEKVGMKHVKAVLRLREQAKLG